MRRSNLTKLAVISAAAVIAFSGMAVCAAENSVYVTQRGDNLSKIAQNVYGDKTRWKDIYEANRDQIKDPNKIWANQHLVIPGADVENPQPAILQPIIPQDMPSQWEISPDWQAASAAGQSYVEQNGLQFYQGTTFQTQGERHDPDNLARFEFAEVNGAINGITVRDADKEGYQVVAVSSARSGFVASYDWGDDELSYINIPGMQICDVYTGRVFPGVTTSGDVELVNTIDLSWGGIPYSIDYIQEVNWDWGEWSDWDDNGNSYSLGTANETKTIVIPKGYDGLAVLVTPRTEGPDPDEEYNVFDNDTETYIMDRWKDGSYLMRVSDLYNILNTQ